MTWRGRARLRARRRCPWENMTWRGRARLRARRHYPWERRGRARLRARRRCPWENMTWHGRARLRARRHCPWENPYSSIMPRQRIHHALIWPIVGIGNQAFPHGIVSHIFQFLKVPVACSHLCIPTLHLEQMVFSNLFAQRQRECTRNNRLFIRQPCVETVRWKRCWCTEEMNMVRHDKKSADKPI